MNTAAEVEKLLTEWKNSGIYTDSELCVKLAYACMGWAYVFGARGDFCTPANRRSRYSDAHPTIKTKCKNFNGMGTCSGCKWYPGGKTRTYDCRGFTYWVVLKVTGRKIMGAGATSQWKTASNWSEKGLIDDMPNVVCCVFKHSDKTGKMEHTGLHVGNGVIIHCSNGVQTGKTTDRGWTHYAIPAMLDGSIIEGSVPMDTSTTTTTTTIRKGDKGEAVTDLQNKLLSLGYTLPKYGADGSFGNETLAAVKAFQTDHGLTADGIVGALTLAALEGSLNGEDKEKVTTTNFLVTIPNLDEATAKELVAKYPGATLQEG